MVNTIIASNKVIPELVYGFEGSIEANVRSIEI